MRTCFQVDIDRIVYCKSFRRLKHKTQVFLQPEGGPLPYPDDPHPGGQPHCPTIARGLALNEDLTEAIALGHDLGHTPFGHAGSGCSTPSCPAASPTSGSPCGWWSGWRKEGAGLNLT